MSGASLQGSGPKRNRFSIPMRGNERIQPLGKAEVIEAFSIPMRGNEHWERAGSLVIFTFSIPMRGNGDSIHPMRRPPSR